MRSLPSKAQLASVSSLVIDPLSLGFALHDCLWLHSSSTCLQTCGCTSTGCRKRAKTIFASGQWRQSNLRAIHDAATSTRCRSRPATRDQPLPILACLYTCFLKQLGPLTLNFKCPAFYNYLESRASFSRMTATPCRTFPCALGLSAEAHGTRIHGRRQARC